MRVVYDASCRERTTGPSLNDCLRKGSALKPLIFNTLLGFRANTVALVRDIEKAFLKIEIHPEVRLPDVFMGTNVNNSEPEVITYRFNRVAFGVPSSPFLLNAIIQHHLHKYNDKDPEFLETMIEGIFVDDLVSSCKDAAAAIDFHNDARKRISEGGFRLRKSKINDKAHGEVAANKQEG